LENEYGAPVERGEITKIENNLYVIKSMTREGVITPAMGTIDEKKYEIGDRVYFFMFNDGKGKILAGF